MSDADAEMEIKSESRCCFIFVLMDTMLDKVYTFSSNQEQYAQRKYTK